MNAVIENEVGDCEGGGDSDPGETRPYASLAIPGGSAASGCQTASLAWVEVAPPGGTTTLALVPVREGTPAGVETGIRLALGTVHDQAIEDVAAIHSDLVSRGVDADPEVVHVPGVPPIFTFRDPDGNVLRVVARHQPD